MGWFLLVDAANGFQTIIDDDRFPDVCSRCRKNVFHVFVLKKCTKSACHTCSTILLAFHTKDIIALWHFDFLQPFCWLYLIRVSTLHKLNNSSNANTVKSWRSDQNRQVLLSFPKNKMRIPIRMKAFPTVANLSYFLFERFCLFAKDRRRPTIRVKMLKDGSSIIEPLV